MATIYYSIPPSFNAGGPSVHVAKMAVGLTKRGHKVIYDKPNRSAVAVCVINSGNIFRKVNRSKTRVILRIDGIYNQLYNEKFNRKIRPDMTALHEELRRTIPLFDHIVYQSQWSKTQIDNEILPRNNNYSIIHNGVDPKIFKPYPNKKDGFIKLGHIGFMRDAYLMETLVGVYKELKKRGHKVKLLLCGSMDGGCAKVFKANKDQNTIHSSHIKNTKLAPKYCEADIYLNVRMGCSSNNVVSEAQACGLSCITPSWGGDCEMVVDGKTGVVVDGGKWDYNQKYINNLADAVEKIIPDLNGFKLRALKHARKNLNTDIMIDKYLKAMGL
jgi:glycosyltransferase involved in cell wall biosynthesis